MSLEALKAAAAAYPAAFPEELRSLAEGCCSPWEEEVRRLGAEAPGSAQGLSGGLLEAGAGALLGRALSRLSPAGITAAELLRRRNSELAAMEDYLRLRIEVVRALLP